MDYILLLFENSDIGSLPQLFLVSQMAINRAHELGRLAMLGLHPISVDPVFGGMRITFDHILWSTPEIKHILRIAYDGYEVFWQEETTVPLEFTLVRQMFTQAGYLKIDTAG